MSTAALTARRDPDLYLNLGRVYLEARQVGAALKAFEHGLRFAPTHRVLRREHERLATRLGSAVVRRGSNGGCPDGGRR